MSSYVYFYEIIDRGNSYNRNIDFFKFIKYRKFLDRIFSMSRQNGIYIILNMC